MDFTDNCSCEIKKTEENLIWTPLRTKPRREKKLAEYCRMANVDFYLPLVKKATRNKQRTVVFYHPMFPGYVFCNINDEKYKKIVRSHHILFPIKLDSTDEKKLIEELKAVRIIEKASEDRKLIIKPELAKGTEISVISGPLQGTEGIISKRRGKTLVTVNIELLGQAVSAEVDVGDLETKK